MKNLYNYEHICIAYRNTNYMSISGLIWTPFIIHALLSEHHKINSTTILKKYINIMTLQDIITKL
jgi:hypothetical protein